MAAKKDELPKQSQEESAGAEDKIMFTLEPHMTRVISSR